MEHYTAHTEALHVQMRGAAKEWHEQVDTNCAGESRYENAEPGKFKNTQSIGGIGRGTPVKM